MQAYMVCFLFQGDKISTCYGNLKFPKTYNGKLWSFFYLTEMIIE